MAAAKRVDVRQLLKQQAAAPKAKVDHPLAKYHTYHTGRLTCVVCSVPVKSDPLWPAHLRSKQHKDAVEALKQKKAQGSAPNASTKRPHDGEGDHTAKRKKDVARGTVCRGGGGLAGLGAYDDSSEEEDGISQSNASKKAPANGLPPGFFDEPNKEKGEPPKSEGTGGSTLPEGFFDDPEVDAKMRQVNKKKQMEDEWESFQKVIGAEQEIAEAMEEEQEVQQIEEKWAREEVEQRQYKSKVALLRQKQLEIQHKKQQAGGGAAIKATYMELDEEEEEDEFDWRAKRI